MPQFAGLHPAVPPAQRLYHKVARPSGDSRGTRSAQSVPESGPPGSRDRIQPPKISCSGTKQKSLSAGVRPACRADGNTCEGPLSRSSRTLEDVRPLKTPVPHHETHRKPRTSARRFQWKDWEAWLRDCWERKWRHRHLVHLLALRDVDPVNAAATWRNQMQNAWAQEGWIYLLYHFSTRRGYVGQTIHRIVNRGKKHWWSRNDLPDRLHQVLSRDQDPFSFTLLPVERVNPAQFEKEGDLALAFKRFAEARERYWAMKFQTMFPKGWNSAWPGRPARRELSGGVTETGVLIEDPDGTAWLKKFQGNRNSVENQLKAHSKVYQRALLDWLVLRESSVNCRRGDVQGLRSLLLECLRQRPEKAPKPSSDATSGMTSLKQWASELY